MIEWFEFEGTFKGHLVPTPCNEMSGEAWRIYRIEKRLFFWGTFKMPFTQVLWTGAMKAPGCFTNTAANSTYFSPTKTRNSDKSVPSCSFWQWFWFKPSTALAAFFLTKLTGQKFYSFTQLYLHTLPYQQIMWQKAPEAQSTYKQLQGLLSKNTSKVT